MGLSQTPCKTSLTRGTVRYGYHWFSTADLSSQAGRKEKKNQSDCLAHSSTKGKVKKPSRRMREAKKARNESSSVKGNIQMTKKRESSQSKLE